VYSPVVGFTVIAAPPADTAGALYDNTRPTGSVTTVDPVRPPVALSSTVHDELPKVGVPASHAPVTVSVLVTVLTPLEAVTVNVSTVDVVADWR